ncbi:MAG: transaldolase [Planctomycetota bacterium]|nr:MAG: transaldolase [Planctomycetota bacterium]
MNSLDQLKRHSIIVADTGDIDSIARNKPQDATTNPSLIAKAAQMPQYADLVEEAIATGRHDVGGKSGPTDLHLLNAILDHLSVIFGLRILRIVPGRVSVEVDARLSFDEHATVEKGRHLISLFEEHGISKERILIKIASTWEGIRAAERLEQEGIHCNLTLLFGFGQAIACADAGVTLISPFVGRILDWFKKAKGASSYSMEDDPGVLSVHRIFNYYKRHGYRTQVMGASFRSAEQVTALCGCDLLTVAPALLTELSSSEAEVPKRLDADEARAMNIERLEIDERSFRWILNQDAMATEKLAEGVRGFADDLESLSRYMAKLLNS